MMKPLYLQYLDCPVQYATYDDFNKRFRLKRPASFNFAYDVADRIAMEEPERTAVLWTDDTDACIRYTFGELKEESDRAANLFTSLGITKGDKVMVILPESGGVFPEGSSPAISEKPGRSSWPCITRSATAGSGLYCDCSMTRSSPPRIDW